MDKTDITKEAIDRIRLLECPTGDLENRITGILDDYAAGYKDNVRIIRDSSLDRDDAQAYVVKINDSEQSIVVLAESGYDDYVARVVSVLPNYTRQTR